MITFQARVCDKCGYGFLTKKQEPPFYCPSCNLTIRGKVCSYCRRTAVEGHDPECPATLKEEIKNLRAALMEILNRPVGSEWPHWYTIADKMGDEFFQKYQLNPKDFEKE